MTAPFISESSLISPLPSTLFAYVNFFVGVGNPEPLVEGKNAGILKNGGINFETRLTPNAPLRSMRLSRKESIPAIDRSLLASVGSSLDRSDSEHQRNAVNVS